MTTIRELQEIDAERARLWHENAGEWSLADWSNATQGEGGELLEAVLNLLAHLGKSGNAIKKIRRQETGTKPQGDPSMDVLIAEVGEELADVILYALLSYEALYLDAEFHINRKFNKVSQKNGFPQRIGPGLLHNRPESLQEAVDRIKGLWQANDDGLRDAYQEGLRPADFLEIMWKRWGYDMFPLCTVIDVADALGR